MMKLLKILNELDEKGVDNIPIKTVREMRRKINLYGRTIQGSDKVITFSHSNHTKEYYTSLVTTAMIGFLNRMCDEWEVPLGLRAVSTEEYRKDPDSIKASRGCEG